MTFGELINILGLQKSKLNSTQTKAQWIDFYFTAWKLYALYNDEKCEIVRYRNEDDIFDGTLKTFDSNFINIDNNFNKLEVVIKNYRRLFVDVFENKNFQTNFKDAI